MRVGLPSELTAEAKSGVLNRRLSQLRGEAKKKGKGKGKEKEKGREEKKEKKSKYYTYIFSGFPIILQMALFPWKVETFEQGTNYFKSLNLKYVCEPLTKKKREKLALGLHTSEEEQDLGYGDVVDDYQIQNDSDGIDDEVVGDKGIGEEAIGEQDDKGVAKEDDDEKDDKGVGDDGVCYKSDIDEVVGYKDVGDDGVCYKSDIDEAVGYKDVGEDDFVGKEDVDEDELVGEDEIVGDEEDEAGVKGVKDVRSTAIDGDRMDEFWHRKIVVGLGDFFPGLGDFTLGIITCHIWRRRSSPEVSYVQNIGLVNTSFFMSRLSPRLKDIRGLLYLLPSMLKHVGYYQEMKMEPHATPFKAESMHSDIFPQQDDRSSCGVFLMKYAELIMAGVPTPWKSIFGQKNIKNIRKPIAIDIFSNGQLCNSL
ncbi:hypothetical protein Ddye_008525 [Dipteronia dyeriana]|uniref:Ubiquitin-like protease family profile domain-containing protein n=1 Tax=Dipteronia dyeriana TaxID=168575 RepID=A0AAD9X9Y5_9ROSI|nr:hypothetical protein Ddye_008525 [Dipteronia dyeriana]